ncbi:DUF6278 family protein [Peterkaempfera bronchialis]|uniref:DUF3806 domain-containing protein n=1 Tax=Peterkaempfera bronchialis TaxID=2126346 RepID=A0A345SV79_9ACTN|nr:DUF6278 family protein [Peterkaempfera bronchialis]AXI77634.1 hypothetical protein C7M71_009450 [Peterkaempfera bronchialis]
MGIAFMDRWRARHEETIGAGPDGTDAGEGIGGLLAECELLREQADEAGVVLDDSRASLAALDQLLPRWRDDPEASEWLGNDAGLYLGTVIVRTVPGAVWRIWPDGRPVVLLRAGRELDVVRMGHGWATDGYPELAAVYAEVEED